MNELQIADCKLQIERYVLNRKSQIRGFELRPLSNLKSAI